MGLKGKKKKVRRLKGKKGKVIGLKKKEEVVKEGAKVESKRRLSSTSEMDESEPKSKIPKIGPESDCEPDFKKIKSDQMKNLGRIPKIEKKDKVVETLVKPDSSNDKHRS